MQFAFINFNKHLAHFRFRACSHYQCPGLVLQILIAYFNLRIIQYTITVYQNLTLNTWKYGSDSFDQILSG